MNTVSDYIRRWFDITGFDWDAGSWRFTLMDMQYGTTANNLLLKEMIKKYNSEMLAYCVLKNNVREYLQMKVKLEDVRTGKFKDLLEFADELESSRLNVKLDEFRSSLEHFMAKPNILGSVSDADICQAISDVGTLRHLSFDCLLTSGKPIVRQTRISKDVMVAGSSAELLLKASSMPDGMFLAFVTRAKDAESYFSLVVKSNGNIMSVNDMPKETFFGQNRMRRNDRYTEDKAYSIFPYESVLETTYKEHGAHVLVDTSRPKSDSLSFDDFSLDEAMRFYIGCILVMSALDGKTVEKEDITWTTALTAANIPLLESKALITAENRQLVESYNREFRVEIPREDLVYPPVLRSDDRFYTDKENTSTRLFNEWFRPEMVDDHDDWSCLLPEILEKYPGEFLSSMDSMKKSIILHVRQKLVEKLEDEMDEYLDAHGDGEEAKAWFRRMLAERKETVLANLSDRLRNPECWTNEPIEMLRHNRCNTWFQNRIYLPYNLDTPRVDKPARSGYYSVVYLKDDGGICNMVLSFCPRHISEICALLGLTEDEVPKEMRGWHKDGNRTQGNPILSFTDPCQTLDSALYRRWHEGYKSCYGEMFDFAITMSRRQWRKTYG